QPLPARGRGFGELSSPYAIALPRRGTRSAGSEGYSEGRSDLWAATSRATQQGWIAELPCGGASGAGRPPKPLPSAAAGAPTPTASAPPRGPWPPTAGRYPRRRP